MTTLKAVPNTNCQSESQEICVNQECPMVFANKVCEAKQRSHVALLPEVIYFSYIPISFVLRQKLKQIFNSGVLPTCA